MQAIYSDWRYQQATVQAIVPPCLKVQYDYQHPSKARWAHVDEVIPVSDYDLVQQKKKANELEPGTKRPNEPACAGGQPAKVRKVVAEGLE